MNTVAFSSHGNDAELTTMARNLGISAGRLLPTLRRLQLAGWVELDERSLTFVYPTAAAVIERGQYSEAEARALISRLWKPGGKRSGH